MLHLSLIHVCVVSNAVQRISESEGSVLEAAVIFQRAETQSFWSAI